MSAIPFFTQVVQVAGIANSIAGVVGTLASARGQQAYTQYDATLLRQQAERERQLAEQEADRVQRRDSARLAAFRARLSGSGVGLHGTPLLVDESAAEDAALNAETVRRGGEARALRYEREADFELARSRERMERAGRQAGTSLLSEAISIARRFG